VSKRRLLTALVIAVPLLTFGGAAWWWATARDGRHDPLAQAEQAAAAGNYARAEALLRPAVEQGTGDRRTWLLYLLALRRLERYEDADQALSRAVEGGLPEGDGRREYALLMAPLDFGLAEGALQRVVKDDPGDAEALQALADGYGRGRRWPEAERWYTRWLEVEPGRVEAPGRAGAGPDGSGEVRAGGGRLPAGLGGRAQPLPGSPAAGPQPAQ